jgi:hypothetical protein
MAQAQVNPFFTPTQISGCYLWLDAADRNSFVFSGGSTSNIQRWLDKSTNRFHANATNNPTWSSSQTRVEFNGTNQYMSNTSYALNLSQRSMFFVMEEKTRNAVAGVFSQIPNPSNQDDYGSVTGMSIETQNGLRFYWNNGGYSSDIGNSILLPKAIYNNNMSGTSGSSFLNGSNTANANASGTAGTCGGYLIGQRWLGGLSLSYPLNAFLYEILVYSTPLTQVQRQQVEGYLAWKWGLQGSLPATHPYKASPIPPLLSPPITLPRALQTVTPITWFPNQIPDLQLWFDAADNSTFSFSSGSNIQTWQDKSSNRYSVGQANVSLQPTLASAAQNSLAGVQLTTDKFLFTAGSNIPNFSVGSQTSVFIAARNASANSGWNIVNTMWFTGAGGGTSRYHFSFNQGATAGATLFANGSLVGQVTSNATPPSSNAILGFTASGTSATIHTNGSSNGYGGVSLPNANNATSFIFGDARNNPSWSSNVMIFEMVGYNRQVTTSERQQIEGYFAHKWGMVTNLPSNQPYKSFPPFVPSLAYPPRSTGIGSSWIPTQISNCVLWVDAKSPSSFTPSVGGTLTAARDNSPSPKTITVTNTVSYIPNIAVVFTNTTGIFIVSGMPSAPYDFIFVGTANASSSTWRTMLRTNSSPGTHPFLLESGTDKAGMWNSAAFYQFGSLTQTPNEKAMFYGSMASDRTITVSKNGTFALTAASPAGNESVITSLGNSVGGSQPYGTLQEIIIYSQTLSFIQRQTAEGYLAWKWGLQGSLPANHPFKKWPPSP